MNGKPFFLAILTCAAVLPVWGQVALSTARLAYESYLIQRDTCPALRELLKAKEAIDMVISDPRTGTALEAKVYKAAIYVALANATDSCEGNLLIGPAEEARNAAGKLDLNGRYTSVLNEVDNSFFRFYIHKGREEFAQLNDEEAYVSFNKASAFKDYPSAFCLAGWIAQQHKDYDAAIRKYTRALESDLSDHKEIRKNLVVLYTLKGDSLAAANEDWEAAEFYKKALETDSTYDRAIFNMGTMILKRAIAIHHEISDEMPARQKTALKYEAFAELDRALPYLQKAAEINPRSVGAWENLIKYYTLKNNPAKASEMQQKIDAL